MAWIYILKAASGRHYIGATPDLIVRLAQHCQGHTQTTKRFGDLKLVAQHEFATLTEARLVERTLKAKKTPTLAISHLQKWAAPTPRAFASRSIRDWSGAHYPPNGKLHLKRNDLQTAIQFSV